jgi:hypothetical protein
MVVRPPMLASILIADAIPTPPGGPDDRHEAECGLP